ncbi:hypothetical protein PG997_013683 [Apiospora hydei]|uniref:Uncharacterized protein n=1 Tax=Apiospora hydei TaxID=1337664 RepID=A0ABR1V9G9_9PEZI
MPSCHTSIANQETWHVQLASFRCLLVRDAFMVRHNSEEQVASVAGPSPNGVDYLRPPRRGNCANRQGRRTAGERVNCGDGRSHCFRSCGMASAVGKHGRDRYQAQVASNASSSTFAIEWSEPASTSSERGNGYA